MAPLPIVRNLKLIVLAGEGEMNDLERRVMAPLVVQVLDQNDRPVAGADVVFRFPPEGPSATFANEKSAQTSRTDAQGQASATGWTANQKLGSFQVHATATYGNQMGEKVVTMSNVAKIIEKPKKGKQSFWSSRKFKILVIAGAAATVAGILIAKHTGGGGSAAAQTSTVIITPGSPTIGVAQ